MGASGWSYFVPYQADIGAALRQLQERMFADGEYSLLPPDWRDLSFEEWLNPNPEDPSHYSEAERAEIFIEYQRWQTMPEPTTIEALQEWNSTEGCHSILDMAGVIDEPYGEFAKVSPLSDDDLFDLFEDELPTRELILAHEDELDEFRDRWEGLYIIVHKDGQPHEIFFAGFSGD
ncbi:MAG TPA: hypothetical protein VD886_12750 [Herpetosiphonaceae bacterium]|nr:hypothetical protein [Herpetosiphonaceae bacterium]